MGGQREETGMGEEVREREVGESRRREEREGKGEERESEGGRREEVKGHFILCMAPHEGKTLFCFIHRLCKG